MQVGLKKVPTIIYIHMGYVGAKKSLGSHFNFWVSFVKDLSAIKRFQCDFEKSKNIADRCYCTLSMNIFKGLQL